VRRVFLSSPLSGDTDKNVAYARRCMKDCFDRGEAPYAPHLLYPQILDDTLEKERQLGMSAWLVRANVLVVYEDLGVSVGMRSEIEYAEAMGLSVERRSIL
jgi:hypothetical protein